MTEAVLKRGPSAGLYMKGGVAYWGAARAHFVDEVVTVLRAV